MNFLVKNKKVAMVLAVVLVLAVGVFTAAWILKTRAAGEDASLQAVSGQEEGRDAASGMAGGGPAVSREVSEAEKYRAMIAGRSRGAPPPMAGRVPAATPPPMQMADPEKAPERPMEKAVQTHAPSGTATGKATDYSGLFSALQLSAEDQQALKKILSDKTQGRGTVDERVHDFLGDELFQVYQDYEKKRREAARMSSIKSAMSSAGQALEPAQEKALADILNEERQGRADSGEDAAAAFNKRVLQRAQEVLSPEQARSLAGALKEDHPAKTQENQTPEQAEP